MLRTWSAEETWRTTCTWIDSFVNDNSWNIPWSRYSPGSSQWNLFIVFILAQVQWGLYNFRKPLIKVTEGKHMGKVSIKPQNKMKWRNYVVVEKYNRLVVISHFSLLRLDMQTIHSKTSDLSLWGFPIYLVGSSCSKCTVLFCLWFPFLVRVLTAHSSSHATWDLHEIYNTL